MKVSNPLHVLSHRMAAAAIDEALSFFLRELEFGEDLVGVRAEFGRQG